MLRFTVGLFATGCAFLPEPPTTEGQGPIEGPLDLGGAGSLWLLVHPSNAPLDGPGIVEIDASGVELARLPLPPGVTSPHGLGFDGTVLWMSDVGDDAGIYSLDPSTGAVLSFLPGLRTEGIGVDGDGLWIDGVGGGVRRIDTFGQVTDGRPGPGVIQDVTYDGTDVIVLTNGSPDYATRIAPDGSRSELPEPVTEGNTGYAMTSWQGELVLVDHLWDEDVEVYHTVLRHVDPLTGTLLAYESLPVEGWITAIAHH